MAAAEEVEDIELVQEEGEDQDHEQEQEQPLEQEDAECVTVETVVTVDSVIEEDGVPKETNHEEAKITQTFIGDKPEPEGPDESLQDGKSASRRHEQVPEQFPDVESKAGLVYTRKPDSTPCPYHGEEEECAFCLFMKAGPCGKRFTAWEACVDTAETSGNNIVEKCAQMTRYLKECMESNPEYYGPVLQAEKAMDEQAALDGPKGDEKGNSNNLEPIPA